jgi:hypothetical protein
MCPQPNFKSSMRPGKLLMSLLPGEVRLSEDDVERRVGLLAHQLVRIHGVEVREETRPRSYQAWTSPERVRFAETTDQPGLWCETCRVCPLPGVRCETAETLQQAYADAEAAR